MTSTRELPDGTAAPAEWPRWLAVIVVLAGGAGIAGAWQWARGAFALGSLLIVVSVVLLRWPRSIWAPAPRVDLARRWQRWGLLVVCAVAVFFRCYQMEPPGLWGDDAINGLLAFNVLDGSIRSPLQLVDHSFSTFHALSNYLIAGAFLLWGAEPLSIRAPGIIANLLAVPLLYGIVSPLFGPRAALVATLFFASSPFQLGHAKSLLQNILGQSLEIAGLCLLVQGALRRRPWMLIAAGIPVALALYTYHAAKLVPLIAAFALWQLLRLARARGAALARVAMAAAATFALCATPAVVSYVRHPEALTDRLSGTGLRGAINSAGNLWPVWDSLWRTLSVFHYQQGPIYHWFGIGTDPGVNVVIGALVVHGFVQSLRRWREPAHALLLGWFIVGLIPGILSSEAPRGYRILIAAPPIFVWAALPIVRLLGYRPQRWVWQVARVACLGLVLAVPLLDFNYYFYRLYTSGLFRWYQADPMVEMARELRGYGPQWTGYIVADNFTRDYESLRFLARAWHLQLRDVANLGDAIPVRDLSGAGVLFMMMRTPFESVALLRSMYPSVAPDVRHEPEPLGSWFDHWCRDAPQSSTQMTVAFFPVSRETADGVRGLTATFVAPDGAVVTTRVDAQPLLQQLADLPSVPPGAAQPTGVAWRGSILAPVDGTYQFRVETTDEAIVSIGRAVVATRDAPSSTQSLAQGLHAFTVVARVGTPPRLRLFWQRPGEEETLIDAEMFFRVPASGLLAEYQISEGQRRRVEPFPYHLFFPVSFSGVYSARWTGRLTVPAPGNYQLSSESDRAVIVAVDGDVRAGGDRLAAGVHTLSISIDGIEGPVRLRLYWQLPDRERELIPPDAFSPE